MVALITFSAGVVGACIGAVATHQAAKRAYEAQMKTSILTIFLDARLNAYKEMETAIHEWSVRRDVPSCAGVYRAANIVSMVAGSETIAALSDIQQIVREYELHGTLPDMNDLGEKHLLLQSLMHHDLLTFEEPTILLRTKRQ